MGTEKLNLLELSHKCERLKKYGVEFGFTVKEENNYFNFLDEFGNDFIIIPITDYNFDKKLVEDKSVVYVKIDSNEKEKAILSSDMVTFGFLSELHFYLEEEILKPEQIKIIFNVLFNFSNKKSFEKGFNNILSTPNNNEAYQKEQQKMVEVKASNYEQFMNIISEYFGDPFYPVSASKKTMYHSNDNKRMVVQLVSKVYPRKKYDEFWYGVRQYQREGLKKYEMGYYAFSMLGKNEVVILEKDKFEELKEFLPVTIDKNNLPYWHVKILIYEDAYIFKTKKGYNDLDIMKSEGFKVLKSQEINIKKTKEEKIVDKIILKDSEKIKQIKYKTKNSANKK